MKPAFPIACKQGFTLVELLLAIALGVLVAGILAALIHGLLNAGEAQASRARGPLAARAALRALAREIACAYAPPVQNLAPLTLATSTEPGKPEVSLAFYAPVPAEPLSIGGYDIEHVTFEVVRDGPDLRELRRISAPCSGPLTNAPLTNRLLSGRFTLAIEALTNGTAQVEWPPPKMETPVLPASLRLSLSLPGEDPLQTEVLIQTAHGISSPVERKSEPPEAE
jgi:prepilin-type N-terminal cleavage/methylation domain-containing protein